MPLRCSSITGKRFSMKVHLLAILLLLSLAASSLAGGKNQSHSVTWGARTYSDFHLERNIITEKSKFLRVVEREYVFYSKYPIRFITQIVITDMVKDGNGGYPTLMSGGPQFGFAKIRFKSQRNKGLNFIVDIYGF